MLPASLTPVTTGEVNLVLGFEVITGAGCTGVVTTRLVFTGALALPAKSLAITLIA